MLLYNLLLMSCLSTHTKKYDASFLHEYKQSGSMCLDALSVNLAKSNCISVTHEADPSQLTHYIRCAESIDNDDSTMWNSSVFLVIKTDLAMQTPELLLDKEVLCTDATLTIAVTQRDNYLGSPPKKRHLF